MTEPPDDLEELLAPRPSTSSPSLRDALLRQTERRHALGRRLRLAVRSGAIAGVLAVGGVAGWLSRGPDSSPGRAEAVVEVIPVPVLVPVLPRQADDASGSPAPPPSASAAELRAEQEDDPRVAARLYRQAGDAFLRDQDYPNATRCYRLYMTRAGDAGLALDSEDTWLLVSLKNAAFKEKVHATKNDG
jgi:hypothetical protein